MSAPIRTTARKAVGLILAFLQKEAPADKVDQLIAGVPGAEAAIAEANKAAAAVFPA